MVVRPSLQGRHQLLRLFGGTLTGESSECQEGFQNLTFFHSDGYDDYLDLDPKTGALKAYLNEGEDEGLEEYGWKFNSIGEIASGLGPGHRVRIADIDGDGVSMNS